jgi:hypothetical protein
LGWIRKVLMMDPLLKLVEDNRPALSEPFQDPV